MILIQYNNLAAANRGKGPLSGSVVETQFVPVRAGAVRLASNQGQACMAA